MPSIMRHHSTRVAQYAAAVGLALSVAACGREQEASGPTAAEATDQQLVNAAAAQAIQMAAFQGAAELVKAGASKDPRGYVTVCGLLSVSGSYVPFNSSWGPGDPIDGVRSLVALQEASTDLKRRYSAERARLVQRYCERDGLAAFLE